MGRTHQKEGSEVLGFAEKNEDCVVIMNVSSENEYQEDSRS